jgi:acyl CoA:acetate/3-ketoacid CoA transferase beta subunit
MELTASGMPTLAPSYLSPETKVWIQSENGLLGMVSLEKNSSSALILTISRVHTQQKPKLMRKFLLPPNLTSTNTT